MVLVRAGAAFLLIVIVNAWPTVQIKRDVNETILCNGYAELCNRSYGNVTYAGAHDSFAFSSNPVFLARTQTLNLTDQLNSGVRLLQAQAHFFNNEIHFCHTDCLLFDSGTVLSYLGVVKSFLESNPNEVVTLLFTNPEGLSANNVWLPVFNASGIVPLTYHPPHFPMLINDWPTLGELIGNNTRIVLFFDYPGLSNDTLSFVSYEFFSIWENPFDSTNATFPCSVNRISTPPSQEDHMYLMNHYLSDAIDLPGLSGVTISDEFAAGTTNGVESIMNNVNGCAPFADNRAPNFILFDWIGEGEIMTAVNALNSLTAPTSNNTSKRAKIIGGSVAGGVALLLAIGVLFCCWWRRKRRQQVVGGDGGSEKSSSTVGEKKAVPSTENEGPALEDDDAPG